MAPSPVLATVTDPDGRTVALTQQTWNHITNRHPELRPFRGAILAAVRTPTLRRGGRMPGEEWFYLRVLGPSRWLKVVVTYREGLGRIRTAFARRAFP
jgi:hypothetical protein